jgi:transcriptional regulator with XRE-family HTH domain
MWLDNLKEMRKKTGLTAKQIAERTNLPERTVSRIFSGDTDAPRVDTLRRIVAILGGSLDELFAESGSFVANADLIALQGEHEALKNEVTNLQEQLSALKEENANLAAENKLLLLKLEHKEEVISLHNYYNNLKQNNK